MSSCNSTWRPATSPWLGEAQTQAAAGHAGGTAFHLCELEAGHDGQHRCFCGASWNPDVRVAARELGRRGGLKGGKARAAALPPERRSEIAAKAAAARWARRREPVADHKPAGSDRQAASTPPGERKAGPVSGELRVVFARQLSRIRASDWQVGGGTATLVQRGDGMAGRVNRGAT